MKKMMVLVFQETEIRDMWAALEVFTAANDKIGFEVFETAVVAETDDLVACTNGWKVNPTDTIATCPQPDILVVVGGPGAHAGLNRRSLRDWLKKAFRKVEFLLAIGTGTLLIANAGLLDGLAATANRADLEKLTQVSAQIHIVPVKGFVDSGKIITAPDHYAGVEACLYVVSKLLDNATAQHTADYINVAWGNEASNHRAPGGITYH